MNKDEIKALEAQICKSRMPRLFQTNTRKPLHSRCSDDNPRAQPDHADIIKAQRERLGTKRGFISVKSNCSLQSYVPALFPLSEFGVKDVLVCTYQAISGAGKTFETWPEMIDNVIPYIGGEEEKSEREPLKIWGQDRGRRDSSREEPELHRTVPARSRIGRSHGCGIRKIRKQAHKRTDT